MISAHDENLRGYEVESSKDGLHFNYIGYVDARGDDGAEVNYTFNDPTPVSGKVESIESGKDGYTAKITTDTKEVYFATISIVNVGGPQNYKQLKIGDVVSIIESKPISKLKRWTVVGGDK